MLVMLNKLYVHIAHVFPLILQHDVASSTEQEYFVPSKVKKWAADDFSKTISWLESQDEKVNYIAFSTCQYPATDLVNNVCTDILRCVLTSHHEIFIVVMLFCIRVAEDLLNTFHYLLLCR